MIYCIVGVNCVNLEQNCMQITDGVCYARVMLEGMLLSGSKELLLYK